MVKFAIVGTGRISDWILKGALQDSRFKAVAVCSRSMQNALGFIAKHPEAFDKDAKAYDSLDKMLEDDNVEAVYIGTPNRTHCDATVKCLDAGKHVICEKPLACSMEEAARMVEASRRNNKALMEAMISTLIPNFRVAAAKIREIAPVRHYCSSFCQYSTKYDALKQGVVSNSFNPQMGGGALPDIGVYTTYPLVSLFGLPQKVTGSKIYVDTPVGDVEVHGSVNLAYPGMTASLVWSKSVDSRIPTEICGEGGNLVLDEVHICRKVSIKPHGAPTSGRGEIQSGEVLGEGISHDEYFYEFEEFINVIESGAIESQVNSHKVSLDNMALMETIASL